MADAASTVVATVAERHPTYSRQNLTAEAHRTRGWGTLVSRSGESYVSTVIFTESSEVPEALWEIN